MTSAIDATQPPEGQATTAAIRANFAAAKAEIEQLQQPPILCSVYAANSQSLTNITWTKVQLNTEVSDQNNSFDSTTNYRFQPQIAGWYSICAAVSTLSTSAIRSSKCAIYKNGSIDKLGSFIDAGSGQVTGQQSTSNISALVYLNGTSDYLELFVWAQTNAGTLSTVVGAPYSYLTAHKL